jgi:uncharacterized protein (DUF4415 family)
VKKDDDIVSYTVAELETMRARGDSRTDWARVDAMTEEELEAAIASDPDWADIPRDWYEHATPHYPDSMRKQVSLRIDPDILAWFKSPGPGYRERINAALRAFVEAQKRRSASAEAAASGDDRRS